MCIGPQDRIKTLGPAAAESEEAKQVQEMYAYILHDIEVFKTRQWTSWCNQVSQTSEAQLKKQLLMYSPSFPILAPLPSPPLPQSLAYPPLLYPYLCQLYLLEHCLFLLEGLCGCAP